MHWIKVGRTFVNLDGISLIGVDPTANKAAGPLSAYAVPVYSVKLFIPGSPGPILLADDATSAEAKKLNDYIQDKCEATFILGKS